MEKPIISLIIPIYNAEKYIKKALDSVQQQTFADFEVLCINDGSQDNSALIAEKYAQQDKRFIVASQKNQGVSAARNKGLEMARGKYIMFLDQDDFLHFKCFENALKYIQNSGADIVQFGFKSVSPSANISFLSGKCYPVYTVDHPLSAFLTQKLVKTVLIWDKIYKAQIAQSVRFKSVQPGEDDLYSFETMLAANNMAFTDEILLYHTTNPQSVMHSIKQDQYDQQRLKVVEEFEKVILQTADQLTDVKLRKKLLCYYNERFLFKEYILKPMRKKKSKEEIINKLEFVLQKIKTDRANVHFLRFRYRIILYLLCHKRYKLARIVIG